MLTLLQACKIKTETLHNEVMTLLQISLPIVEHQREISSLKTQLVSLENSAMIPPSTTNHLTTYIPISKSQALCIQLELLDLYPHSSSLNRAKHGLV